MNMMVALRQLRTYFLNGEFRSAHNMLTERLMRSLVNGEQLHFFNVCMVYVLHKLKEFQNAKQMASELLTRMEKEGASEEKIFPVKFLLACALCEMKNNDCYEHFYQLARELKSTITRLRRRNNGTAR